MWLALKLARCLEIHFVIAAMCRRLVEDWSRIDANNTSAITIASLQGVDLLGDMWHCLCGTHAFCQEKNDSEKESRNLSRLEDRQGR